MNLLILDTAFNPVGIIDAFKSMIWVDRYQEAGDFELYVPASAKMINLLRIDYYIWFNDSDHTMIIEDLELSSDVEQGNFIIVTGRSLESILDRRIVWKQTNLKGNFQNAIKKLLNDNIINPMKDQNHPDLERKIENFIFEPADDEYICNLKIDTQYTGDNIYDVITTNCKENNIGFKIVLSDNNEFVFSLYKGLDRSYGQLTNPYVSFSPQLENIINSNFYTSKANLKTVTLVSGEGEGASRKTTVVGGGSGLERRELFSDARDISSDTETGTLSDAEYLTLLKSRGLKNLAEYTKKEAFEGEVNTTNLFKYGVDFFIGDVVQIANEYGNEGVAYISEIIYSISDDGITVYPTFKVISKEGQSDGGNTNI